MSGSKTGEEGRVDAGSGGRGCGGVGPEWRVGRVAPGEEGAGWAEATSQDSEQDRRALHAVGDTIETLSSWKS